MFSKNGKTRQQFLTQYPEHFRRVTARNIEFLHSLLIFNLVHSVTRMTKQIIQREKLLGLD